MGKTEKGAIWLNQSMFSSYEYWQFWRNTDDRDVKKFLNFFTDLEVDEINRIVDTENNINNLKIILANEATKILHGEIEAKKAEQTAKDTFSGKGLSKYLPEIKINNTEIKKGISLLNLLADNDIVISKSEARRIINNNGVKINDVTVDDEKKIILAKDFRNKILKISCGKKKHFLVKII